MPTERDPAYSDRYVLGLQKAAEWHQHQSRKGERTATRRVPYVAHLLAVSSLVWEDGGDEEEAIAALLHDSIEDQGKTRDEIAAIFGARVGDIVAACTDSADDEPEEASRSSRGPSADPPAKAPWRLRKVAHIARLRQRDPADAMTRSILRVTAADKLANLRAIVEDAELLGNSVWARFKGGLFATHWYYREMIDVVGSGLGGPERSKLAGGLEIEFGRLTRMVTDEQDRIAGRAEPLATRLRHEDPLRLAGAAAPLASLDPEEEYRLVAYEAVRRIDAALTGLLTDWYGKKLPTADTIRIVNAELGVG